MFSKLRLHHSIATALAVLAGMTCATANADATWDKVQKRQRIAVGVMVTGGPFGSIDPATQQPVGINVDIANALGQQLDVAVDLVPVQTTNRVQFLQQGKVDLLVANMDWNPERDKVLGHVPTPYYRVGGAAITLDAGPYKQWSDLAGHPVCTSQGSAFVPALVKLGAEVKAFKSAAESLLALRGNNCVAAVHDGPMIKGLVAAGGEWNGYRAITPELNAQPTVIWTRQGESDTQQRIDGLVKEWHRSGWLIEREKANHIVPASPDLVKFQQDLQASY